ncbi:GNAT family N-acetyltransferase [Balneatrix alpica]|uniref:GNAT family N-acetyltransferase n=1 Tax=Balneatrix alpica TaxID=75684 RepID=A0ABV5ZAD2_9GAMM|nr:GNAT family N-acetyltransferase [Balneatrix alpica]
MPASLPPRLTSQRIQLRQWQQQDLDAYAALLADAETVRYIGHGQPYSRQEAWMNMAVLAGHWQLLGFGIWALCARDSGELLGRVGFIQPEGWPGLELAWLLKRSHWGQGLASEAASLALDCARQHWPANTPIISLIHPHNQRSARLAQRLGALPGEPVVMHGQPVECFFYPANALPS